MSKARQRLDHVLVDRGLAPSRSRAKALIMAGQVRVAEQVALKPGTPVKPDDVVTVDAQPDFVSRGGDKLREAIEGAGLEIDGRTCIDIGASTGGFTDCLLQRGAVRVIAIDVGYGQLDYRLRSDERVHVLERVNARYVEADNLPPGIDAPDLLVMDVAFISVTKVLPAVTTVLAEVADALILVKPQFECGPGQVGSGGIVSAATVRRETLTRVAAAAEECGWQLVAAIPSPIRGQSGNWECFLQLRRPAEPDELASAAGVLDSVEVPEG